VTDETWRPVVPTGREDALSEKFPGYLREAVFSWIVSAVGGSSGVVQSAKFVAFQNAAHTDLGFRANVYYSWDSEVLPALRKIDDAAFTNLLDYFASTTYQSPSGEHPLERILSEGGSAWMVARSNGTKARLTQRVSAGVHAAVSPVLQAKDAASLKLQEAWLDAYGTNPRASAAYSHAVVAVETAVLSVIPTGQSEATLANVFSILEADEPKWRLVFRDNDRAPGGKSVAMMLRTLWRGHGSRHGRPDYADASLEEARAAVILAATLVQWFNSGVVRPVQA
jgi:hypothetical protein